MVLNLFDEGNFSSMTFNFKIMSVFFGYGKIENVCIGLAIIFELCFRSWPGNSSLLIALLLLRWFIDCSTSESVITQIFQRARG